MAALGPLYVLNSISSPVALQLLNDRTVVAPVYPDWYICDSMYGDNIYLADCTTPAITLISRSYNPANPLAAGHSYPVTASSPNCHITIELAGPGQPSSITLSRKGVVQAIKWVLEACVLRGHGLGGFVTMGTYYMMQYVSENPAAILTRSSPGETRFFTLTISSQPGQLQPGIYDPSVAKAIADYNVNLNRNKNTHNSPAALRSQQNIQKWNDQATRMGRGETVPFWETNPLTEDDEMNYECDANLGNPLEVDCTQIEWNQLTPPSDTLQVGPGEVIFLNSNSCVLAISSAVSLVLRWGQIRAAVAALMNVCIQTPYGVSQGGRAYYRPKSVSGRRNKRESTTGWNALPPSAKIQIFQQLEPWISQASEMNSCTWKAVTRGSSITTCPSK